MAVYTYPFVVPGGKLTLCLTVSDEEHRTSASPSSLRFEYEGYLPKDMALELVRQTPDDGFRVNGMTVLEFLESL